MKQMGGWDKIDNGRLVKAGNMRIQKADMAAGGGMAQTRAQYGRYTCEGFWRLIDVLEGRVEADLKCSDDEDEDSDEETIPVRVLLKPAQAVVATMTSMSRG